ncbi:response regulator [Rhizobium terrae]|uniref:response regulator n=1 Tax=Rhizobium terrae TaxID=2171756 RepID=UPI000E3E6EAE|nr:response regulator [Rhizobium terrae]
MGLNVLVVEDEMLVALLTEDILRELGHGVAGIAPRVSSAMSIIDTGGIDIALLDINLGAEKSFPVADTLEEKGIPFIFITGYGPAGLEGRYPGRTVLNKPFTPDELHAALQGNCFPSGCDAPVLHM